MKFSSMLVLPCLLLATLAAPVQGELNGLTIGGLTVSQSIASYWNSEWDYLSTRLKEAKTGKALPLLKEGRMLHQPDWYLDHQCTYWDTDRDPLDIVLRRTEALLADLKPRIDAAPASALAIELADLRQTLDSVAVGSPRRRDLFLGLCALRRRIALANPLLNFDEIIAMNGHNGTDGTWQHVGFSSVTFLNDRRVPNRGGVGPVIISNWKSDRPQVRPVLKQPFSIFNTAYDLSYDGKVIYFAVGKGGKDYWTHCDIYRVNTDGSDLRQLTSDHLSGHPCELPNGRIVFVSEGPIPCWDRCEGKVCNLWLMKNDGTDKCQISWHETHEYYPAVDNDGKLIYSRWDYIDRGWNAAQGLWECLPDGRNPRAPHGNYPYPHYNNDGNAAYDGRKDRPWSELHCRPVPGEHGVYTAIAGAHHWPLPGAPILIDTTIPDDNKWAQWKMIEGDALINECNGGWNTLSYPHKERDGTYVTPEPLSRSYYLISDKRNVLLLDRFGNREPLFIFDDLLFFPRPFRSRTKPHILPTATWQGERARLADHQRATISVINVYESDFAWPANTKIEQLRIIQFNRHKGSEPYSTKGMHYCPGDNGAVGDGWINENCRCLIRTILGTVPVESDGSAYFEAPVGVEIMFQALDGAGMAVQSMRSGTCVHPGEQMTCLGCHEDKWKTVATSSPLALKRPPSPITPEVSGSNPLNFYRLVKPVFQNKCLPCHKQEGKGLQDFRYEALMDWSYWFNARDGGVEFQHGGHRTQAGRFGFRESKMGKQLMATHVPRLTSEELHRVVLWIDCNSQRYASWLNWNEQEAGQVVWPTMDCDPKNPLAIEREYPWQGAFGVEKPSRGAIPSE